MHRHNVSVDIAIASLDISHELLVDSTSFFASNAIKNAVGYSNLRQNIVESLIPAPMCELGSQGEGDVEKSEDWEVKQGNNFDDGFEVRQALLNVSNAEKVPPEVPKNTLEAPLGRDVTCALGACQGDNVALPNKTDGFCEVPVLGKIRSRLSMRAKPLVSMLSKSVRPAGDGQFGTRRVKFSSRLFVSKQCTGGICNRGRSLGDTSKTEANDRMTWVD